MNSQTCPGTYDVAYERIYKGLEKALFPDTSIYDDAMSTESNINKASLPTMILIMAALEQDLSSGHLPPAEALTEALRKMKGLGENIPGSTSVDGIVLVGSGNLINSTVEQFTVRHDVDCPKLWDLPLVAIRGNGNVADSEIRCRADDIGSGTPSLFLAMLRGVDARFAVKSQHECHVGQADAARPPKAPSTIRAVSGMGNVVGCTVDQGLEVVVYDGSRNWIEDIL
ncbi:hypothetical protein MKEN_01474700 [Mycena kentingensis (nom. inval.)]|nr:hypothetical protein MKEN_01474700 [Mycena kentingensis (nom. inval.)]